MDPTCPDCKAIGRRGYCAPLRCYCGHDTCPAFASYRPPAKPFAYVELLHPPRDDQEGEP